MGKGNHSPHHIQKIKPKVEQICKELGLQYVTEENAGRMYINLQGGQAVMPEHLKAHHGGGYHQGYGGHNYGHQQQTYGAAPTYPQMSYQQGGQQHGGGQQQQDPNADIEAEVKKYLPMVLRLCRKQCCTVMVCTFQSKVLLSMLSLESQDMFAGGRNIFYSTDLSINLISCPKETC